MTGFRIAFDAVSVFVSLDDRRTPLTPGLYQQLTWTCVGAHPTVVLVSCLDGCLHRKPDPGPGLCCGPYSLCERFAMSLDRVVRAGSAKLSGVEHGSQLG